MLLCSTGSRSWYERRVEVSVSLRRLRLTLAEGETAPCHAAGRGSSDLAAASHRQKRLAIFSIIAGSVGLIATALFISGNYLGTGIGGVERIAAYPLPLWLIVVGVALLRQGATNYEP